MENEESNLEEETSEKPESVLDEDSKIEESETEEEKNYEINENSKSKIIKKKKTNNKSKSIKKQEIINEKEDSEKEQEENNKSEENEELDDNKDLVEHAAKAVEHISSETAQEMDESAETENTKKVEAALFIAGRFLTLQELVMLTDINPLMIKEILEKLIEKYNDNSGIEIIEKGGGWKMDVCKEHVHMINKLATGNSEFTKAEQETLAVIAYKQPVKQSVIVNIRGNKAYEHIKKFIENELVVGKRVGHTKELRLSEDFFEYFHLGNQKEISDDHPSSESIEELGDLQKKGNGSTEIIGIENNEEGENNNNNNNPKEQESKNLENQKEFNENINESLEEEGEEEIEDKEVVEEEDEKDSREEVRDKEKQEEEQENE